MNANCGKCGKTVYPTEQVKCLDKVWHKGCFKCNVCNMTLTMKNYKGYDKMPYCNAHYPTNKPTAVADTPENRRIAENTKIQSAVKYHADFERQKGSKTSVADDPETARIRQNTANQSNVSYWGVKEQRSVMESKRPNEQVDEVVSRRQQPGKISDYDPAAAHHQPSPYSQRQSANVVYDSQKGGVGSNFQGHRVQPGSIADYDPTNDRHSSIVTQQQQQQQRGSYHQQPQQPQPPQQPPPQHHQYQPPPQQSQRHSDVDVTAPEEMLPPPQQKQPPAPAQVRYRAMYDYSAADDDEVSFVEGDMISNCEIIDEGWMTGVVMRTGQHGMLPSNYVERA